VRRLNIDGDGQGDLAGHGGEHRAVFVYQIDSYRYWQKQLGRDDFSYGQFGENLTVEGLTEDAARLARRIGAWLSAAEDVRATLWRRPLGRVTAVSVDDDNLVHPIAYASFEQALASIRVAECWYGYVGSLGYGVKTQWR
jgi:hypothetical protein